MPALRSWEDTYFIHRYLCFIKDCPGGQFTINLLLCPGVKFPIDNIDLV